MSWHCSPVGFLSRFSFLSRCYKLREDLFTKPEGLTYPLPGSKAPVKFAGGTAKPEGLGQCAGLSGLALHRQPSTGACDPGIGYASPSGLEPTKRSTKTIKRFARSVWKTERLWDSSADSCSERARSLA